MNLQGSSDFTVETELAPDEVLDVVNRILRTFAERTPLVTRASAAAEDDFEITVKIWTVSGSFETLEQELDDLADEISAALLRQSETTRVSRGATEMIPA